MNIKWLFGLVIKGTGDTGKDIAAARVRLNATKGMAEQLLAKEMPVESVLVNGKRTTDPRVVAAVKAGRKRDIEARKFAPSPPSRDYAAERKAHLDRYNPDGSLKGMSKAPGAMSLVERRDAGLLAYRARRREAHLAKTRDEFELPDVYDHALEELAAHSARIDAEHDRFIERTLNAPILPVDPVRTEEDELAEIATEAAKATDIRYTRF